MPKRSSRKLPIASVVLAGLALGFAAIGRGQPAPKLKTQEPAEKATTTATPEWASAVTCQTCHRPPAAGDKRPITDFVRLDEYDTWSTLDKHHLAWKNLESPRGKEMQARLKKSDPSWDVTTDIRCLSCHAPAATLDKTNTEVIQQGVSCTACHGAYKEWRVEHGTGATKAALEKWIDLSPQEKHDKFGMTDLRDPAVRTETCASCHVGDAKAGRVVTHEFYAAGHPPLPGLEVSTFSEAQPPHWWAMKQVPYLNLSEGALIKKYGINDYKAQIPRFEKLRKQYKVDEFPTQYAKLVAVGGLVTFREAMDLFAETSPAASAQPDFARFDCAACHHDLKVWDESFRQKREYKTDPGRPPVAEWPAALARIAIYAGDPAKVQARLKQLEAGLASYRSAVGKAPFGDDSKAVEEAKNLSAWAKELITELDSQKLDVKPTIEMLRQIAKTSPPDYPSARQLAWSFKTVYNEMNPRPANDKEILATIDALINELKIKFEPGAKDVLREVGARLDADEKFNPENVKSLFKKLDELLPTSDK